jgi:hypothetical protein
LEVQWIFDFGFQVGNYLLASLLDSSDEGVISRTFEHPVLADHPVPVESEGSHVFKVDLLEGILSLLKFGGLSVTGAWLLETIGLVKREDLSDRY